MIQLVQTRLTGYRRKLEIPPVHSGWTKCPEVAGRRSWRTLPRRLLADEFTWTTPLTGDRRKHASAGASTSAPGDRRRPARGQTTKRTKCPEVGGREATGWWDWD